MPRNGSNSCLSSTINSHPTGNVFEKQQPKPSYCSVGHKSQTHVTSQQWVDGEEHCKLNYSPNKIQQNVFPSSHYYLEKLNKTELYERSFEVQWFHTLSIT